MNVLTIFDQRITAIFEEGAPAAGLPFSFKRLAKRAVREMEDETFVIDGVDTAPALYTILVSSDDDQLMRPMYPKITDEISQLIEAQAKKRGYTFVGRPLVRFMVDPALRRGRFSVFAENIDPRTLARLRDEENVYLGITPPHEIHPEQSFVPKPVPLHEEEPAPVASEVAFAAEPDVLDDYDAVLDSVEEPLDAELEPAPAFVPPVASVSVPEPEPELAPSPAYVEPAPTFDDDLFAKPVAEPAAEPVVEPFAEPVVEAYAPIEEEADEIDPFEVIPQDYVADIAGETAVTSAPAAQHAKPAAAPACTLIDLGSGRVYNLSTPRVPLGRERVMDGIVLSDPNASRRHAELVFDGTAWNVRDLNSTNGTLLNDVDVQEARLKDGDVLTIGLTNLEFRAG